MRRPLLPLVRAAAIVAVMALAGGCAAGALGVDQAAAVDGTVITVKQLTNQVTGDRKQAQAGQPTDDKALTRQALDELIQAQVVLAGAKRLGVSVPPNEVDAQLAQIKQQAGKNFDQLLKQSGLDIPTLRTRIEFNLLVPKIQSKLVPSPTDAELAKQIAADPSKYMQFHTRHVLAKDEATANAARALLEKKSPWSAVAKKYSTDAGTKDKGGDLGFLPRGQTAPAFEQEMVVLAGTGTCKGVTNGTCASAISSPVKTEFGWHVMQVIGLKLLSVTELRTQQDQSLQQRRQQAIQSWYTAEAKKADVKVNPRFGSWDAAKGTVADRATAPATPTSAGKG